MPFLLPTFIHLCLKTSAPPSEQLKPPLKSPPLIQVEGASSFSIACSPFKYIIHIKDNVKYEKGTWSGHSTGMKDQRSRPSATPMLTHFISTTAVIIIFLWLLITAVLFIFPVKLYRVLDRAATTSLHFLLFKAAGV